MTNRNSNSGGFSPFVVLFHMAAPVQVEGFPTHLDGLLSYALLQEELAKFTNGEIPYPPNPDDLDSEFYTALPLKRDEGVYCASVILPVEKLGNSTRYFIRSSDAENLAARSIEDRSSKNGVVEKMRTLNQIDVTRGVFKSIFEASQLIHSPSFAAYGIGDPSRVYDLLNSHVFGLGKNRAKGFGTLRDIEVLEDEQANDRWRLRSLNAFREGYIPMLTPTRPPYWNRSMATIGYMPSEVL